MTTVLQLQRRVERYIGKYVPLLGLEGWRIDLSFGPLMDTEGLPPAGCSADAKYRHADIQFDVQQYLDTGRVHHLERDVVHELMHCHTARLADHAEWLFKRLQDELLETSTVALERLPFLQERAKRRPHSPRVPKRQ